MDAFELGEACVAIALTVERPNGGSACLLRPALSHLAETDANPFVASFALMQLRDGVQCARSASGT